MTKHEKAARRNRVIQLHQENPYKPFTVIAKEVGGITSQYVGQLVKKWKESSQ